MDAYETHSYDMIFPVRHGGVSTLTEWFATGEHLPICSICGFGQIETTEMIDMYLN